MHGLFCWKGGLVNFFLPRLALKHDSPNLCLPNSWGYMLVLMYMDGVSFFFFFQKPISNHEGRNQNICWISLHIFYLVLISFQSRCHPWVSSGGLLQTLPADSKLWECSSVSTVTSKAHISQSEGLSWVPNLAAQSADAQMSSTSSLGTW
jgi:hypothetical protein